MKTLFGAGIACGLIALTGMAQAKEVQCNRQQTRCVIDNQTDYTIGDRVGFFNTHGELVALGKVNAMRGKRRSIKVNRRHGKILNKHSIALVETKPGHSIRDTYNVYKKPSELAVGGSLGLATVGIGEGSPGTEFHGFAQWRKWKEVELTLRGTYMAIEGEVARTRDVIETESISINGYGLSGGVGYTLRKNKTLGFKGELGLGFMYIDANVGGDPGLVEEFPSKVTNGFGGYSRGSLGAVVNMKKMHLNLDVTQSLIHDAMASTLSAGITLDIK